MRHALLRPLALLLLAAPGAAAAAIELSWDKDLAFDFDRANYERTIGQLVDEARQEATSWLGLPLTREVTIQVMAPARYEAQFGSDAAWTQGARYQAGAIHVNGGARLDGAFAGLLLHEMVHAVLDDNGAAHRLPRWLNEGLAERLQLSSRGFDRLDSIQVNQLENALDQKRLLPLPQGGLSHFGYLQSFAAVLFLEEALGREKLLAVVRRTVAKDPFEAALAAEAGWSLRRIEEGFTHWVDHLQ